MKKPSAHDIKSLIRGVTIAKGKLHVTLADGRGIFVPLEWYPKLRDATARQRANWRLIGGGIGVHWKDLDEDLSVDGLLRI